jgi:hypothetical protein
MLCFILHARLRVHLASGIPCALLTEGVREILAKLGRVASRDRGSASSSPAKAGDPVRRGLSAQSLASLEYWVARSSRAMTSEFLAFEN